MTKTLQLCPKCGGAGKAIRPPWLPAGVNSWTSSATSSHTCNLCHGAMVIDVDEVLASSDEGSV